MRKLSCLFLALISLLLLAAWVPPHQQPQPAGPDTAQPTAVPGKTGVCSVNADVPCSAASGVKSSPLQAFLQTHLGTILPAAALALLLISAGGVMLYRQRQNTEPLSREEREENAY